MMSFDFHAREKQLQDDHEAAERDKRDSEAKLRGIAQSLWYQISQYATEKNPVKHGTIDGLTILLEYDFDKLTITVVTENSFIVKYEHRDSKLPFPPAPREFDKNGMMDEVIKFVKERN